RPLPQLCPGSTSQRTRAFVLVPTRQISDTDQGAVNRGNPSVARRPLTRFCAWHLSTLGSTGLDAGAIVPEELAFVRTEVGVVEVERREAAVVLHQGVRDPGAGSIAALDFHLEVA